MELRIGLRLVQHRVPVMLAPPAATREFVDFDDADAVDPEPAIMNRFDRCASHSREIAGYAADAFAAYHPQELADGCRHARAVVPWPALARESTSEEEAGSVIAATPARHARIQARSPSDLSTPMYRYVKDGAPPAPRAEKRR
jgi:hypothetical protein